MTYTTTRDLPLVTCVLTVILPSYTGCLTTEVVGSSPLFFTQVLRIPLEQHPAKHREFR